MSQDIKERLPELKRLAEAATPGPWSWWTSCSFRRLSAKSDGDVLHGTVQSDGQPDISFPNGGYTGPDASYIAAANPATVLALIAHIEALERQLAALRQAEHQAPEGYFCAIAEADFEHDTVTLKMEPGYRVRAGRHMLVPLPAAPSAGQAKSEGDPFALLSRRMIVCETCGNKRCPHATDKTMECTGSNDPVQVWRKRVEEKE